LNLDARSDASNRYYVRLSYNQYDDKRTKHAYTTNFSKGKGYATGPNPGDIWVSAATVQSALTDGLTVQTLENLTAGGRNLLGPNELDYSVAYSYGSQKNPYYYGWTYARPVGVDEYYNRTDYNFPAFGATGGADPYDPALSLLTKGTDTLCRAPMASLPPRSISRFPPTSGSTRVTSNSASGSRIARRNP